MVESELLFSSQKQSKSYFSKSLFSILFLLSLLGYIPGFPYWLYNIATFVTLPVILILLMVKDKLNFSKDEIYFLIFFLASIICSYVFSSFGFNLPGFLRAFVPVCFYYLVRILNIKKDQFYYDFVFLLLIFSFLFALYQFLYQPLYGIGQGGEWIVREDDVLPMMKRPTSFLGNANVFGVFNLYCFIILYIENNKNLDFTKKIFVVVLVLVNIILFAKSRTSMLGFIIIVSLYNFKLKNYKTLMLILGVFFVILIYVLLHYEEFMILDQLFRLSALSDYDDNSYTIRKKIAEFAFSLVIQRPFFGVGVGNENLLMLSINAPHKGMESATLQFLIERGIIGYFIYLYVLLIKFVFTKNNFPKFLIGIVIISVDFTETVCVLPQLTSFLAIYLAICKNGKNINL